MATIAPQRQEDAGPTKRVVNFSRPRRDTGVSGNSEPAPKEVAVQEQSNDGAQSSDLRRPDLEELIHAAYNDDRNVRSVQTFYKSNHGKSLPDEPRFSTDTLSTIASVAELPDISRHDSRTLSDEPIFTDRSPTPTTSDSLPSLPSTSHHPRTGTASLVQRPGSSPSTASRAPTPPPQDPNTDPPSPPTKPPPPPSKPAPAIPLKSILRKTPTRTNTSTSSDTISPPSTASSSAPLKSILKHTTVEQYSEAASSEAEEDDRSHPPGSASGAPKPGGGAGATPRSGSVDSSGRWSSSDYDTSQLSEKELKKLKKKGINPALYLEMKAARGGKKFGGLGSLTGNAYVS